jgi:hypothetical protein
MTTLELAKMCHESAQSAGFSVQQRPTLEACLDVLWDAELIEYRYSTEIDDRHQLQVLYRGLWKH